jgi:hypothetical protein
MSGKNQNINNNGSEYAQKELACCVESNQASQRNFRRVMSLMRINDELQKEILELRKKGCSEGILNNKCQK